MPEKKNKRPKDDQDKNDPYRKIDDFFSFAEPARYRKLILSMLRAAYSEGYWKKSYPGELLMFQEQLEGLIKAVHQFNSGTQNLVQKRAWSTLDESLFLNGIGLAAYTGFDKENQIWDVFPRHLTKKEFVDPWLVFEKFLKYKTSHEWKSDLETIISYALSPYGNESALDYDYITINIYIQKLVEAAYLVKIRTNKYLEDKNRVGKSLY